jgi:hypothetical protein
VFPENYLVTTDLPIARSFSDLAVNTQLTSSDWTQYSNITLSTAYDTNITTSMINTKLEEEKNSSILIKNRSHIFRSFIKSIPRNKKNLFNSEHGNNSENYIEIKKRVRYWSMSLFNEVEIYISKMLVFSEGESASSSIDKELKWININEDHTVIPIGLDIWSTRGGVLQDDSNGIQWDKTFLIFLPSAALLKKIDDMSVDICFSNASEIKIPNKTCKNKVEQHRRNISID